MTKAIPDKAEVTLELPDKLYSGTFEQSSRFDAHFDVTGVSLSLDRPGDTDARKSVHVHIHYEVFADMLRALASSAPAVESRASHCAGVREAAEALYRALAALDQADVSQMSPEEQELILQLME
jgi:hypothetical protein